MGRGAPAELSTDSEEASRGQEDDLQSRDGVPVAGVLGLRRRRMRPDDVVTEDLTDAISLRDEAEHTWDERPRRYTPAGEISDEEIGDIIERADEWTAEPE